MCYLKLYLLRFLILRNVRLLAQRYKYKFGQSVPVEVLVQQIADEKQGYTQFGGLRPYGVSFIFAGWKLFFF